ALGASLIHLLTGTAPSDLPVRELRIQFADRVNLNSGFVSWLEKIVEPAPEQRFTTARQALEVLKNGLALKPAKHNRLQPKEIINNSGCGINNITEEVPDEIKGWNWGAFLLPWFWLWTNQVWVGLLCFVPQTGFVVTLALGAKGNEWAWKSRRWRSIEQFKAHQRGWTIAGLMIGAPISIFLWSRAIAVLASML
ncbi:MAG: serine/threonine protein kinase, partial [Tolypothrix sp. Co-bin9]|nr:serine/threonine protein kinase [Tolypothrix sp. Co-bin9]